MRNDYDEKDGMNAIQRERMERRAATRRKSAITTAVFAVVAVAVIAGIIIAITALVGGGKKNDDQEPTTVTATIATEAPKTETAKPTENAQTATQSSGQQATQAQQDPALQNNGQPSTDAPVQSQTDAPITTSTPESGGTSGSGGNVMHYYAYGQTSYGYDWTYSGGGGVVAIDCGYNFDNDQYDFTITGVSPGTTSIVLYYNTDDGVQQPVYMTVNVDDNLNVTQIG